jgi:glc operon protein GlcG
MRTRIEENMPEPMDTALPPAAALPPPYGEPISLADALAVVTAAEAAARRRGWPMVIAVVDSGGHLVALHRLDQAQHGSISIAQRKAETAVDFRRPTAVFEGALATGGLHLRLLAAPNLMPLEGGLPLMRDGKVIGAIGVSGMQSTQDAEIAAAGAAALG